MFCCSLLQTVCSQTDCFSWKANLSFLWLILDFYYLWWCVYFYYFVFMCEFFSSLLHFSSKSLCLLCSIQAWLCILDFLIPFFIFLKIFYIFQSLIYCILGNLFTLSASQFTNFPFNSLLRHLTYHISLTISPKGIFNSSAIISFFIAYICYDLIVFFKYFKIKWNILVFKHLKPFRDLESYWVFSPFSLTHGVWCLVILVVKLWVV